MRQVGYLHLLSGEDHAAARRNIMDYVPLVSVIRFGMCMWPAKFELQSALAAAFVVLTPSRASA
jgi:hypothetical protein